MAVYMNFLKTLLYSQFLWAWVIYQAFFTISRV